MKLKKKGFAKAFKKATTGVLVTCMMLAPINVMANEMTEMFEITIQTAIAQASAMMEMFAVPGVTMAVVDTDSGFTWTQGLGYADVAQGISVTEDTLFSIGSTAKTVTAVAIMQLVETGVLDLDEPIITYLPEFSMLPNPLYGGDYRNITTRMLLNHTSGIQEFSGESISFSGLRPIVGGGQNRDAMNNMFSMLPNLHMRNQELNNQAYNNTGYVLLGILVARLTGIENYFDGFVDFTQENIFYPSKMTSSSFEITPENRSHIAVPHVDTETAVEGFMYVSAAPAGSMVSNAVDMARFMHIMLNGGLYGGDEDTRILQSATINEMIAVEDGMIWGLGFMQRRHASGAVSIGHGGTLQHHTEMLLDFENGIGVFVSVNGTGGAALPPLLGEAIWKAAVYEKTGVSVPLSPLPYIGAPFMAENLEEFEGWYSGAGQLILNEKGVLVFPSFQGSPMVIELNPVGYGFFEPSISGMDFPGLSEMIFSFRQVDGTMALYIGTNRQGVRLEPTPAPKSFERWIGRWGTVDEEGNENLVFTLGINESGFAYSMLGGVMPLLEEVVDDYTIVTLGRGYTPWDGVVRTFSVENGTPTVRYSGEVLMMLSDVIAYQYRFVIGATNFSDNGNSQQMSYAPILDLQHGRTMLSLIDIHTIFGEVELNLQLGENLQNGFGEVRYIDGQLFVPLAYVAYVLDLQVSWDSANQAVYVNS